MRAELRNRALFGCRFEELGREVQREMDRLDDREIAELLERQALNAVLIGDTERLRDEMAEHLNSLGDSRKEMVAHFELMLVLLDRHDLTPKEQLGSYFNELLGACRRFYREAPQQAID